MGGILCDVKNVKISCNLILAVERDIILDFFSFCYGCDVTLIIKSHTLNIFQL